MRIYCVVYEAVFKLEADQITIHPGEAREGLGLVNKYAKSDEEVFHFLINSDSTWQKYLLRAFISVRIERMLTREGLSEKRPVRPRKK